jgi:penicillin-binding protein 1C
MKKFLSKRLLLRWAIGLVGLCLGIYYGLPWLMPLPPSLLAPPMQGQEITDRNGKVLRKLLADGQRTNGIVSLAEIPLSLRQATLAAEDKRFYAHGGIDFLSLARAMRDAVAHRRSTSGASTITQQLIKISHPRPRTLWTKVVEMLTARRLEMTWSKDRILEEYLNRLDYGNLRKGCAVAAQGYFSKPLRDCSVAECSLLAGLPQAPSRLNPYQHPERAKKRQSYVLDRMKALENISQAEWQRAMDQSLQFQRDYGEFLAPHFAEMVLASAEKFPKTATSIDLTLQDFCERMVRDRLATLKEHHVEQASCVVIDNASGGIRALVGSREFKQQQVNGALAKRSPGSALKPFTYLLAMQAGDSPSTMVDDLPIEFSTPSGLYKPKNYSGRTYGPVSYRVALANSLNLAAVRVLDKIGGPETLISALQAAGLKTLTRSAADYGLGLTIGGGEVKLLELANAYACLARQGMYLPVNLWKTQPDEDAGLRIFDPTACYLLADIMADNDARVRSFGSRSALRLPFPVAVKTGTSTDYRDNWTIGFTPQYTVAVWVGNFDGSAMQGVSGVTGAGPIFRDIFTYLNAQERQTWFEPSDRIATAEVDPLTGRPVPPELAGKREVKIEQFHQNNLPTESLPGQYDPTGRLLLPKAYAGWLASPDNWLGNNAALAPEDSPLNRQASPLRIQVPLPGTTFLLDPDITEQGQMLFLKANAPATELRWNSETLAISATDGRPKAKLQVGEHILTVENLRTNESRTSTIIVRRL